MKKIISKLIALALVAALCISFAACAEVENGSKIERIKITISLYDEEGEATDYDVYAKLYVNYAPNTVAHVKGLIESGYYNSLDVTHLISSYCQFGDYSLNVDGTLKELDQGQAIEGEFEKKGFTGNRLTVSAGALILQRDEASANGVSKYDTGKATIAVALSSSAPFDSSAYCVFGKIVADDNNSEADSESAEYLSSLERMLKVVDCISDEAGRKLYYCVADDTEVNDSTEEEEYNWKGQYITYAAKDGEYNYYKGIFTAEQVESGAADAQLLTEEEVADLSTKVTSSTNFRTVPTLRVVIKSITLVK